MITVREYAKLVRGEAVKQISLDHAVIPSSAFEWLLDLQGRYASNGTQMLHVDGSSAIKLDSYVGFLKSPCGIEIEILPKSEISLPSEERKQNLRLLLINMLTICLGAKPREFDKADLRTLKRSWPEWLISRFLGELVELVQRGLRFDYLWVEEESRYLRGQLDIYKQVRQPLSRQHLFQIRHDIFSPDRPENRLLKTALEVCFQATKDSDNWRVSNELRHFLEEVFPSSDIQQDLKVWSSDRLMQDYQDIKPWCELILSSLVPFSQKGKCEGVSLLFPMEQLFEQYVAHHLARQLAAPRRLKVQAAGQHLIIDHDGRPMFNLKPDLLVMNGSTVEKVLDTKWKLLDQSKSSGQDKYGISQADMYQMFAYGQKYMGGEGHLLLIYPQNENFDHILPIFKFSEDMKLWAVPFDLERKHVVGQPLGLGAINSK